MDGNGREPGPNVSVVTFGCRLNSAESETMQRYAEASGPGDTVIVNTCAVTQEAVRQARQAIRRLRREKPGARLVVTGCAAQIAPETFAAMPEVDAVLGNAEKRAAASWQALADPLAGGARVRVDDIQSIHESAGHIAIAAQGRARAFVEVQNGCDHRCTFCVIPLGRGPSRSVPVGAVVDRIGALAADGVKEVVLTGVDLTSYGSDLPGTPRLGRLVRSILRHVPGLARLRLSSIDSIEADGDLLRALGEEERLMPHLHLSLQSGADLILKRMKRRHSAADAIAFCEAARRLRPDVVFGADLIAGFPTEDDAMARQTLDHVEACGLTYLHVFPFSPRPGTPAARMPKVPQPVVRERAAALRQAGAQALIRHLDRRIGSRDRALVESFDLGRLPDYTSVTLVEPAEPGSLVPVTLVGHDGARMVARAGLVEPS